MTTGANTVHSHIEMRDVQVFVFFNNKQVEVAGWQGTGPG